MRREYGEEFESTSNDSFADADQDSGVPKKAKKRNLLCVFNIFVIEVCTDSLCDTRRKLKLNERTCDLRHVVI